MERFRIFGTADVAIISASTPSSLRIFVSSSGPLVTSTSKMHESTSSFSGAIAANFSTSSGVFFRTIPRTCEGGRRRLAPSIWERPCTAEVGADDPAELHAGAGRSAYLRTRHLVEPSKAERAGPTGRTAHSHLECFSAHQQQGEGEEYVPTAHRPQHGAALSCARSA
eukprot:scaffold246855_cov32-Tisochrysis_lutea.AAC.2